MKKITNIIKCIFFKPLELLPVIVIILVIIALRLIFPRDISDIIIITLGIVIILISYKGNNKKRKNQIKEKDKVILENFIKKEYPKIILKKYNKEEIDYWYIHDEIELVDSFCRSLLSGDRSIAYEKEDVLDKYFNDFIESLNIREINEIYAESKEIKKIVYKYYDTKGNWKIKK